MNPLNQYPQIRQYLYMLQWLVNGVLTIAAVVFLVQQRGISDLPQWYAYTVAIAPVLWTYLGITAQVNVPKASLDDAGSGEEFDDGLSYEEAGGLPFPGDTPEPPLGDQRLY